MGMAVVTVAAGGLPVVDVGPIVSMTVKRGTPVTEAANGRGVAVTKVTNYGVPVTFDAIAAATATMDGAASNATLSNGNLTVTHANSTTGGGRSTALKTSGKFYFEVTIGVTHGYSDMIGILESAGTYGNLVTNGTNCSSVGAGSAFIYSNNGSSGKSLGAALANGNVISVAVDLTARKGWFRNNGGGWNGLAIGSENPATGLGGVVVGAGSFAPAIGFGGSGTLVNDVMTANFGQAAYAYAAPSGFDNWSA